MKFFSRKNLIVLIVFIGLFASFSFALAPHTTQADAFGATGSPTSPQNVSNNPPADAPAAAGGEKVNQECNAWSGSGWVQCGKELLAWVVYFIMVVLAAIMAFAGILLDESIKYTIVDMAKNLNDITSINLAWQTLRDFANMFFIFILLYVSIRTILQVGEANAKRTLIYIIITAILINFSIFFTKALIDLSNIITLGFYQAMVGNLQLDKSGSAVSLSNGILGILNLQDIFKVNALTDPGSAFANAADVTNQITKWGQDLSSFLSTAVMSIILIFTVTFSFFAAAFLLIFRYFVLIFLIILSPLAFATYVLPETKDRYNRWLKALLGQVTFPVLYMMLMYVAVLVLKNTFQVSGLNEALKTGTTPGKVSSAVEPIIKFSIAILFINSALITAKKYADSAGDHASKMLNWGLGKVDATRKLTQGIAGRSMVRVSGLNKADDKFKKSAIGNTYLGRIVRNNTTAVATSAKFGSGSSVSSIAKEQKSLNEKYARDVNEKLEKTAEKKVDIARMAVDAQRSKILETSDKLKAHQDEIKIEEAKLKTAREIASSDERFDNGDLSKKRARLDAEKDIRTIEARLKDMREQETVLKSGNTVQEDYLKKAEGNYSKQKTESLKTSQIEEINRLDRGLLPKWLRSGARKETIKSLREKVDKTRRTSGGGKGKKNKDKSPEEIEKEAREWVEEGRLDDLKEAIAKVE